MAKLEPLPFLEAIKWARARGVVLPEVYYGELQGFIRSMAFSVAGLAKLDQLQAILDSLVASLEGVGTFAQWLKRIQDGEIPLELPRHRLENIFRTNIQGAYGRGRCEQQKRTLEARPYFLYDAINDSRVRPTHAAMDGFVARYDDPTWRVWTPPAGYQCVLPDTRVMGNMRVGLKAWYAGKAVEIHTASGVAVTVTANHPVLTRRGWVRAQQIQKGDDLLCYLPGMERSVASVSLRKSARTTGVIDNQKAPPRAEEVFEALAAQRLGTLPAAAFNLYGDALALKSDVYVAGADSVLMDAGLTDVSQRRENFMLQRRNHVAVSCRDKALNAAGSTLISCFSQGESKFTQALFDKWARYVQILRNLLGRLFRVKPLRQRFIQARYGSLTSAFPGSLALTLNQAAILFQGRPLQRFCLTTAAQDNALALEPVTNGLTADTKVVANRLEAFASGVATNQGLGIFRTPAQHFNRAPAPNYPGILNRTRFDAAVAEQSVEKAATDFALFEQLAHSSTRQVQIDQVVGIRDFAFSGHVYDFETENGLLTANGIITSNCRCRRISLSEAQAKRFQAADAKRLAKDPELAQARASAQPDKGWDYDPCAEPDEGLRRAWERWVGKVHPLLAEVAKQAAAQAVAAPAAWPLLQGSAATLDEIKRLGGERLRELLDLVTPDDRQLFPAMTDRGIRVEELIAKGGMSNAAAGWLRSEMLRLLKGARPVGGQAFNLVNKSGKGAGLSRRVAAKMPDAWVDKVNASGGPYKVAVAENSRGWHSGWERKIQTNSGSTAEHEWAHAVQNADPVLDKLFQDEHQRRTVNEALEWLGGNYKKDELAKKDGYVCAYQGKEYAGRGPLEVITMALQAVLGEDYQANALLAAMLRDDREMLRLTLGALFHYLP